MAKKEFRKPGSEITQILAENIRVLRKRKGLSQEELGGVCGFHRTYIGSVERGERNVTVSTLEVFAEAFGISVPELLTKRKGKIKDGNGENRPGAVPCKNS